MRPYRPMWSHFCRGVLAAFSPIFRARPPPGDAPFERGPRCRRPSVVRGLPGRVPAEPAQRGRPMSDRASPTSASRSASPTRPSTCATSSTTTRSRPATRSTCVFSDARRRQRRQQGGEHPHPRGRRDQERPARATTRPRSSAKRAPRAPQKCRKGRHFSRRNHLHPQSSFQARRAGRKVPGPSSRSCRSFRSFALYSFGKRFAERGGIEQGLRIYKWRTGTADEKVVYNCTSGRVPCVQLTAHKREIVPL